MKRMLICVLMAAMLCVPALAEGTPFDGVQTALVEAGWLDAACSMETVELDSDTTPVKYIVCDEEAYAELIVDADGQAFQYAFKGKLETAEDLAACIAACGLEDAQEIAQAVMKAYEKSDVYQKGRPEEKRTEPSGTVLCNGMHYQLSQGWLYVMDTEVMKKVF